MHQKARKASDVWLLTDPSAFPVWRVLHTSNDQVLDYLERNNITRTCVKEIYCKVFGHFATDEVPNWESKKITEIFQNLGLHDVGSRKFKEYGNQKAWEFTEKKEDTDLFSGFMEVTEDDPDCLF